MYIFVVGTVLFSVASVCALGFIINVKQIDNYYKHLTEDCAITYANYVDAELLKEILEVAEADEYQEIRNHAEEIDDDSAVVEYLKEKGLWERYVAQREDMIRFQHNMKDIKYIYIVALGDVNAEYASEDHTAEFVFKRADKYMYEEKNQFKRNNTPFKKKEE